MSEGFRDRLRRLRREPGSGAAQDLARAPQPAEAVPAAAPPPGPPLPAVGELPTWLRARLGRRGESPAGALPAIEPLCAPNLGEPGGLIELRRDEGACALRRTELDAADRHGAWSLDEVFEVDPRAFELSTGDAALAGLDPSRAVFLDTETTGLAGGAGTSVFLVGLGWFEGRRFVLWQGFLRSPAEERALLAAVAERVSEAGALVSFFGKSFDRHRLEDKMRLQRVPPPFAGRAHLDLYHPLRRLYGAASTDGRLSTMEASLCGLAREADLPGSRAPEAWFDYLAGRPHRLEGVFRHNALDVLSLVTLTAHLGRVLVETRAGGAPLPGCARSRAAALARLFHARRAPQAESWFERHLERAAGSADPAARESLHLLAETHRLARRDERAERTHRAVVEGGRDAFTLRSRIALSMLAEHRRADRAAALEHVREARTLLERVAVGPEHARLARDLERRARRLDAGE